MSEYGLLSKASKFCLDNAKQYVEDAQLLYSAKSFGHALALTVLSDVEVGKSVIYHLCSKELITEKVLPNQFLPYFRERKYEKLASETWWVGLVIASKIDVLVPSIFTLGEYSRTITMEANKSRLSQETKKQTSKLIEEIIPENKRIHELLEFACQSFFVNFKIEENKLHSPSDVKKSLVKERIKKVNERIVNGEPFLLLSFSKIQKKIAQGILKAAFESIIPIRTEINQFTMSLTTC